MDDIWFQKLALPSLSDITPPPMISILNTWFSQKDVQNTHSLLRPLICCSNLEMDLINFLKEYIPDCIIAGGAASYSAKQKEFWTDIDLFIPIYENIDTSFNQHMEQLAAHIEEVTNASDRSPSIQYLLEFCNRITSREIIYQTTQHSDKQIYPRFFTCRYSLMNIVWIEVLLQPRSYLTSHVPRQTLFTFYLLAGKFDIVTCRAAILTWIDVPSQIGNDYRELKAIEFLDLIHKLPGYNDHILKTLLSYYEDRCMIYRSKMHYSNNHNNARKRIKIELRLIEAHNSAMRFRKYLNEKQYTFHTVYRVHSLTHLCLSLLVSLSDLYWVKFKKIFTHTKYELCSRAQKEMMLTMM